MAQRTPVQREAYREGCRERNRRYYARKRGIKQETVILKNHLSQHGYVPCVQCGEEEVIPVCGFCRDGLDSD
jgi:hypothetical protein